MSPSKLYTPVDIIADMNYADPNLGEIDGNTFKQRYLNIHDEHTRKMTIHDIRTREHEFTLKKNGFQFVTLPKKDRHEKDPEKVEAEYYPELAELLKNMTGADHVHLFNHCVRAALTTEKEGDSGQMHIPELNGPSGHPHCDYSSIHEDQKRTAMILPIPEESKKLIADGSRFFFIGTWKPIKTLERNPLCVCDVNTVPDSDYKIKVSMRRYGKGSNAVISHAAAEEQHQWYYMNGMTPEEIVIFAGYDSKQDEPGWRCPHNSFEIPGTEHLPPRESIECRALAIWE
ncbi:hypothetical protein IFR05_004580 [Cadophora sp. M221]|nr:hypothetical protein IFR05_004580 [Cadophora sp. M221]